MLLIASADYGAGYQVGEVCAILALAALTIGLGLRAFDLRGRRAAPAARLQPAELVPGTSVGPPGWAEPARPVASTPQRPPRTRRARRTDAVAALVFGVLLVGALVRFADHHTGGPWNTEQGRLMRAGFVAGCQRSSGGVVPCECIFERLRSTPQGETPTQFALLSQSMTAAVRARNVNMLPPEVVAAFKSCGAGAS